MHLCICAFVHLCIGCLECEVWQCQLHMPLYIGCLQSVKCGLRSAFICTNANANAKSSDFHSLKCSLAQRTTPTPHYVRHPICVILLGIYLWSEHISGRCSHFARDVSFVLVVAWKVVSSICDVNRIPTGSMVRLEVTGTKLCYQAEKQMHWRVASK